MAVQWHLTNRPETCLEQADRCQPDTLDQQWTHVLCAAAALYHCRDILAVRLLGSYTPVPNRA